ncbi:signaling lymphocytic activation molecule-like isoform X3 [Narcine bancroftii]|uniref:signaling lymphocytic activation molecule-like isoform X3 n=1 Tax=Narcine bancroftii TaxID=1343680 RepID=UPI003832002F
MMGRPLTSTVWMIYLLLWSPGGLGQRVVKPATHQVVIGMLGQSVTLPGNGLGGISTSWDFSMLHMKKKVEVCVKYPKIPPECKRKTVRLNLEDNSLEIWNLTQSDQGLYELRVRTNESLYENAMELRVYERVSTPVINVTAVYSDVVCNATLRCLLEGGTAAVYSWWTRDGEVTEDVSHMLFEDGRSLALSLGLQHNHKVYSCNVRNPVSEANGSVDLAEHCLWDEGDGMLKPHHIGLIFAFAAVFLICVILCVYCKRRSKNDEGRFDSSSRASDDGKVREQARSWNWAQWLED